MNIKLQLGEVRLLFDKRIPIEKISLQLQPLAKQSHLIFPPPQVGAGYLQWSLPGSDWVAFSNGSDEQKRVVAQIFSERKALMKNLLQGSFLQDAIFQIPSDDFIFYRQKGEQWEIALAAWGYRYIDKPAGGELDTWVTKHDLQKVNIAFAWSEQLLPGLEFKLSGHNRVTSPDGFMHIDGLLPVGSTYEVETHAGRRFTLKVEKGKSDYIFDLTQYFLVEVTVCKNGMPLSQCVCDISFNGQCQSVVTDTTGKSQSSLPLLHTPSGQLSVSQPPCEVVCRGESAKRENQQQTPVGEGDVLSFVFDLKTETPPVPEPPVEPDEPEDRHVRVKVEVFKGNQPVPNQTCVIKFHGESELLKTNESGEAFYDLVVKVSEKRLVCEVTCEEKNQSKDVTEDTEELVFRFDQPVPPPKPDVVPEPEYVYIELKDYAGAPLVDLPFWLTTRKKGKVELRTDKEGRCKLPKDWFTPKEKMKVDFVVSKEYQQTHDIHHYKNKKK